MCCLFTILLFVGPRATAIIWYLFDTQRWAGTFDNLIVPLLGFIFLPWTMLAYVFVFAGGIDGFEWVIMVLAFLVDIGAVGGGAYNRRQQIQRAA